MKICSVYDCERTTHGRSEFCQMHYYRMKRNGTIETKIGPAGFGCIDGNGYKRFGKKVIYEHRLLAELALGRPLPKEIRIHHMNGNRSDNTTPLNLVICPNESYHQLLHRRTALLYPELIEKK